jgi:hypothetical protein
LLTGDDVNMWRHLYADVESERRGQSDVRLGDVLATVPGFSAVR